MTATGRTRQIDEQMELASQALTDMNYFEAERRADKALALARGIGDFGRMTRIVLPLQEARRQRLQLALDFGEVTILGTSVVEDTKVEAGCYLVRPPQVGADARRLRLMALERDLPIATVCREPLTMLRLCPIVAIAPSVTIRTKIDPPDDPDRPDMAWFTGAMEALGDAALDELDPELATLKRIDALIRCLDAIPDHERLHQALADACREAERDNIEATPVPGRARRAARSRH